MQKVPEHVSIEVGNSWRVLRVVGKLESFQISLRHDQVTRVYDSTLLEFHHRRSVDFLTSDGFPVERSFLSRDHTVKLVDDVVLHQDFFFVFKVFVLHVGVFVDSAAAV